MKSLYRKPENGSAHEHVLIDADTYKKLESTAEEMGFKSVDDYLNWFLAERLIDLKEKMRLLKPIKARPLPRSK